MERLIVLGSWKIRHAEPLGDTDRNVRLIAAPEELQIGASISADLRGQREVRYEADARFHDLHEPEQLQNLSGQYVPLAVV